MLSTIVKDAFEFSLPEPDTLATSIRERLISFASVDWVSTIDSTNLALLEAAKRNNSSDQWPRLLGAHHQTQGQGRLGRPWLDAPGRALMFSCGFTWPAQDAHLLAPLAPALGTASAMALEPFLLNPQNLRIKWPNDLMLGSGKLAGLLAQSALSGRHMHLVLGMGINLSGQACLSQTLKREVADIATQLRSNTTAQDLVCALALAWQHTIARIARNGFVAYYDDYAKRDYLAGQHIKVTQHGRVLGQGQAHGLDEAARLLVITSTGVKAFDIGDVSVRLSTTQDDS